MKYDSMCTFQVLHAGPGTLCFQSELQNLTTGGLDDGLGGRQQLLTLSEIGKENWQDGQFNLCSWNVIFYRLRQHQLRFDRTPRDWISTAIHL